MSQLHIHKQIDDFFKTAITDASVDIAKNLITRNKDAERYFFATANEEWLKWIWEKGLLSRLKEKGEDPTKSYRLPELDYLNRMSEKEPQLVAEIILSVPISEETFNLELVDRFFWIIGQLPVAQIKLILPKVLTENWLKLTKNYRRSGYDFQRIVKKFDEVKDYDSLLVLAKIIFTVRAKEEFAESKRFSIPDKLFYLGDVSATEIFDAIFNDSNNKKEDFLALFLDILCQIINIGKDKEKTIFEKIEPFYLLDVDIFTLELDTHKRSHLRADIQNFIAGCKELIRENFESNKDDESEIRRIYNTYVSVLPDTLTSWRLKLYAITLFPKIFIKEVEEALFRVFNVGENHYELDSGAEYHQGLIAGFGALDEKTTQREYINNVIQYYGADLDDKKRAEYRKADGREILSYIRKYVTPDEIIKAEVVLGEVPEDGKFKPHPSIGQISSGFGSITPKAPINLAELTVENLVAYLKKDGSPEVLNKIYKDDDFFSPRGVEGLGEAIKEDFKKRKSEYIPMLHLFFDRKTIYPGYVYSILRGVEEMIRAKEPFTDDQYTQIINFFELIQKSGQEKEFEKSEERSYLSDWITVHKIATDILLEILAIIKDNEVFKKNKQKILGIIRYLLSIKSSPSPEDDDPKDHDPAGVAINSVRGQAYRAFVQYAYNEGSDSLSQEVKDVFEYILNNESSNAVRFTVGQFLGSFYFRDINFIKGLLPKIFPKGEGGKENLYFATWEGYLNSSLYKELFAELEPYYEYAITLDPQSYPEKKTTYNKKDLDELLAVHLALAFAHFDFNFEDSLFKQFWSTPNENRHYEFVSFIGRSCLTRSQAGDEWLKENKVSNQKLIDFWNWIITQEFEPKTYSGFGFWINPDTEVIDENIIINNLPTTLKKSEGDVDWDYGMIRKLTTFAEIDPLKTLEVIKYFLLLKDGLNPHRGVPLFSIDHEIKEALEIIYKNEGLKESVEGLIDELVEKGSSTFWGLKGVLI